MDHISAMTAKMKPIVEKQVDQPCAVDLLLTPRGFVMTCATLKAVKMKPIVTV
jgi:hypothetical protein